VAAIVEQVKGGRHRYCAALYSDASVLSAKIVDLMSSQRNKMYESQMHA
jgi:hypothetical protein